jgi:hypothetical protein
LDYVSSFIFNLFFLRWQGSQESRVQFPQGIGLPPFRPPERTVRLADRRRWYSEVSMGSGIVSIFNLGE